MHEIAVLGGGISPKFLWKNENVCRFLHTRAGWEPANSAAGNAKNDDGDVVGAAALQSHPH